MNTLSEMLQAEGLRIPEGFIVPERLTLRLGRRDMTFRCPDCKPYKRVFYSQGRWFREDHDGWVSFAPNRCCKCMKTTDSQNDRFCDDCWIQLPWRQKLGGPASWVFAGLGILAMIRFIVQW